MQNQSSVTRSLWSSRFGFIMVTAGAAVGLGNIWKFPYMAGQNGGGIFVLLYLLFIFTIGVPAMIAELMLGRRGRQNPVNTLANLAKESKASPAWQGTGWLGAVTLVLVLSFYSVVAGWSIAYLFYAFKGIFVEATPQTIVSLWHSLLASPVNLILWQSIFIVLTMGVIALGVNQGIEKASRWMMPGLFLILILLVIYAAIEGDFREGFFYLFSFKLNDLTPRGIVDALGQAYFSLATGAGCILIYGSYLSRQTDLVKTVMIITVLDVLVAILSVMAIFPLVFAYQLAPESGPGLMFHALPLAFSHMPGAYVLGIAFFSLLLFAAWTSSISMGEPLVALLNERFNISRRQGSFYVGVFAWFVGLASVFSFNLWSEVKIFNRYGIFQLLTDLSTNILLPIGALLFSWFAGWKLPLKITREEFGAYPHWLYFSWLWSVRILVPITTIIHMGAQALGGS